MKKNLLKSLFTAFALVFTAIAAQAQCYIIGNDNKWVTNKAGAELQLTEEGVYEGDVTFSSGSYFFFITTKLMEESDDWNGLKAFRYNPASSNTQNIAYNKPSQFVPAAEGIDGSFHIADTGTHHITVNFNNNTVVVDGTYPESIYILGSDGNWETNKASATLKRVDGTDIYTADVTFTGNKFAFFTTLSEEAEDLDNINKYRWAFNGKVTPNREMNAYNLPDYTSTVNPLGTYKVTFQYTDKTFKLYDPNYVPVVNEYVYFVGDANNWKTNSCFAQLKQSEDEENVYRGEVELSEYFAFATKLTEGPADWKTFNINRWGPAEDGTEVTESSVYDLFNYETAFCVTTAGKYNVAINLNINKFYVNKMISTGISSATTIDLTTPQPYYDLTGRNLGTKKPAKGLYIRNGQKIVVK